MSESLNQKYETLKAKKLRDDRLKATENRNARQKEIADVYARQREGSSMQHADRWKVVLHMQ